MIKPGGCDIHLQSASSTLSCHSFLVVLTRIDEVWWSDRIWKMNLPYLEQGELPLHGEFPPIPLLTVLINLPFPSTLDANLYPSGPLLCLSETLEMHSRTFH